MHGVQGLFGQGADVPVAQHEVEHGRADRSLRVAGFAEDQALHGRAHAHGEVEQARFGQQAAEDHFLHRVQADIGVDQLARLHENFHDFHARRAGGLTRAAEQAAAELVGQGLGVFQQFVRHVVDQEKLAARHVGFLAGSPEHGADRLAHAAFHAGGDPVVQRHEAPGQFVQITHKLNPH